MPLTKYTQFRRLQENHDCRRYLINIKLKRNKLAFLANFLYNCPFPTQCFYAVSIRQSVLLPLDNGILSNRGKSHAELVGNKKFYFTNPMCFFDAAKPPQFLLEQRAELILHTPSSVFHTDKNVSVFGNAITR